MEDLRKGVCPLCQHNEIIEAAPQVHGNANGATTRLALVGPPSTLFGQIRRAMSAPDDASIGEIVMYACRACGYTQSFVLDAQHVPIDAEHGTRLIEGAKSGDPYR